jgi:hypothetical protein
MFRKPIVLLCACMLAASAQGCDNECCSVTPETRYAHIELYPGSLDFMAVQAGPQPAPQKAFLFNSGGSCLRWKVVSSDPWIECRPDSGFTGICGDTDTLRVSVNSGMLEKGTHKGSIYVQSDDADNDPGRIAVTCSVVSIDDIFLIKDAWWTDEVDVDSSGCPESAKLTWDADVLDGSTREVSAQVFYRAECTEQWQYYYTTSCWTISGEDSDDTYFVTVDNLHRAAYEFSIILYQCGGADPVAKRDSEDDSDLKDYCLESLVTYSIYDAWWADETDADGDGCRDSGMLAWDADVDEGLTRSVQGHVYYRPVGSYSWTYYRSTACYDITGKERDDSYFLSVEGLEPGRYEFMIDLYECNGHGKAAERSFETDADLADQCFDEYVPPPTGYRIRDAWWTGSVDQDADGYYESRTLVWDPDVDEGTAGSVVSKVFYLVVGTDVWMYYGQTECLPVIGTSVADTLSMEISGIDRECYHFAILLYECGDLEHDVAIWHYSQDDDLREQCFEPGGVLAFRPEIGAPPALTGKRRVAEGRAPVNPYGGVKEPRGSGASGPAAREGLGRPAPGAD